MVSNMMVSIPFKRETSSKRIIKERNAPDVPVSIPFKRETSSKLERTFVLA